MPLPYYILGHSAVQEAECLTDGIVGQTTCFQHANLLDDRSTLGRRSHLCALGPAPGHAGCRALVEAHTLLLVQRRQQGDNSFLK
jgi:hypothetical protein